MMSKIVIDLDNTLTLPQSGTPYEALQPNQAVVEQLRNYKKSGFEIAIYTARNMRTHQNSVGKINASTLPVIIDWLKKHSIPYDEIHVGKPWCGTEGFYVDDRAIRPSEFINMSFEDISELINAQK